MFDPTFVAFLEEAQFTKEILGIGVTQLFKANYATKGIYYQSFTCLSTGLERFAKLCLILNYYICNTGHCHPKGTFVISAMKSMRYFYPAKMSLKTRKSYSTSHVN